MERDFLIFLEGLKTYLVECVRYGDIKGFSFSINSHFAFIRVEKHSRNRKGTDNFTFADSIHRDNGFTNEMELEKLKKFTEVLESEKDQPDEFLTERNDRLSVRDEIQEMYLDAVSENIWLGNKLNAYKELVK